MSHHQFAISVLAVLPIIISPAHAQITQTHKLTGSDAVAYDYFGNSVGISGEIVIAGARSAGYLFDVTTGQPLAKLTPSDPEVPDFFGFSVDISGDAAIVGASGDDALGYNTGSAYLFDVHTGHQRAKLTASDAEEWDLFGKAVAIGKDTAIVAAEGDDEAGRNAGSVYVFDVHSGSQVAKLIASDTSTNDAFGRSVSISGNIAIVGAVGNGDGGSAYLFDIRNGKQLAKLTASDRAKGFFFGESVSISGDLAIVGALGDDHQGFRTGSAYLFDVHSGDQLAKLVASDAAEIDYFGHSVSISGDVAIVGAYGDDDGGGQSGAAYLFDVSDPVNPVEIAKISASDAAFKLNFGSSVAVRGDTAFVGSPAHRPYLSSAYLFVVPEPSTLVVLTFGGLSLIRRDVVSCTG